MIRRLFEKLFVPIPRAHALAFRNALTSENLVRIFVGGATLSVVEAGVLISIIHVNAGTHQYPLALILFNLAVIPPGVVLMKRSGRVMLKRALVYLSVGFYLAWACSFTWANRASSPEFGANILLSPYLLMVYGIAIVVYLEPAWSACFFAASLGLFIAMTPFGALSERTTVINIWNALALNIFAWLTSRMIFVFRLRTFIGNRLIREKNDELEAERTNLVAALASVKHLSGLLPICSNCKKVRDDSGYWQQVELYISERSEATFSHGLCPDCMKKFYPDEEQ